MNIPEYDFFDENEFEMQFASRANEVRSKFGNIAFLPAGNPFVDTGAMTIAIHADISLTEVTLGHALEAFLNINHQNSMGKEFVRRNKRTKAVTMVYSLANPMTNPAYGKSKYKIQEYVYPNKAQPSPLQERIFRAFQIEFLYSFGLDATHNDTDHPCVSCGTLTQLDFNELETIIDSLIKQDPDEKKDLGSGVHRGWFPLIGSIGSEAQALPGFSEFQIMCGKCLFLINFIPQVSDLANGKLALYQSNNTNLVRKLIQRNFDEFNNMDASIPYDKKLDVIGKEDRTYHIMGILDTLSTFSKELMRSNLVIWMFNNIGLDPDIEYMELPEETLVALYEFTQLPNGIKILAGIIGAEERLKIYGDRQFLDCIYRNQDYPGFYRNSDVEIGKVIPQIFYDFYQIRVMHYTVKNIQTAQTIAMKVREQYDPDRILKAVKERGFGELRSIIQPAVLELIEEKSVGINEVINLYASHDRKATRRNPWKLFRYYLHQQLNISIYEDLYKDIEEYHDPVTLPDCLQILQALASFGRTVTSHGEDKLFSLVDRYSIQDIRQQFITASKQVLGLSWKVWTKLVNDLRYNEIQFYYRVYSREADNIKFEGKNDIDLIAESGLHPNVAEGIINYIEERIKETSFNRAISEIPDDLKRGRYTAEKLFLTITSKLNENGIEHGISEFTWFTYEKDNSSRNKFSWSMMRDKIRILFYQYKLRKVRDATLEEQIKEK